MQTKKRSYAMKSIKVFEQNKFTNINLQLTKALFTHFLVKKFRRTHLKTSIKLI